MRTKNWLSKFAGAASLIVATSAFAANAASSCPAGTDEAIVRISAILPTGSREGFKLAAEHHMAWYRRHGFMENRQVVLDVLLPDAGTLATRVDSGKVMTIHYHVPDITQAYAEDRVGWDAYVAEYKANPRLLSETSVCMPLSLP